MNNEYLILGIICGVLIYKLIYPIFEGISDIICLRIEECKNNIAYRINNKQELESPKKQSTIGFDIGGEENE